MYASLGQLVRGWSRILYDALGRSPARIVWGVLDALVFSQSGHVALAFALILWARGETSDFARWLLGMSLAHHVLAWSVMRRVYRLSVPHSRHVGWYPLGNFVLDWILIRALGMCLTGRVTWVGTVYGRSLATPPIGSKSVPNV